MSRQNVDAIRQAFEVHGRRGDREAFLAMVAQDAVWDLSRSPFPDARESTAARAAAASHAAGYCEPMPETSTTRDLIQKQTSYTDIDEARAAAERLAEDRG